MPGITAETIQFDGDAAALFNYFKDQPHAFFLDSSLSTTPQAHSYIGWSPFHIEQGEDIQLLKKAFNKYRLQSTKHFFPAGAVGYLGYDSPYFFAFYDTVLTFNHEKAELTVSSLHKDRPKAILNLIREKSLIEQDEIKRLLPRKKIRFKSNFTKAQYLNAIKKALGFIRSGNIYQINLSHQIKSGYRDWQRVGSPWDIYQVLRQRSPSEFGAYFNDGNQVILSASPERFVKLVKSLVQLRPMKGTRPRGKNPAQDKLLKEELTQSPKEIAELLMVTDLERNDLGQVCEIGSVKVKAMRTIESYASVFQATSAIEGQLHRRCDQFDLLEAIFPSGSVTGCPKLEAMKLIKKLEHGPRGIYTGALGYISFSGAMDLSVMIRTLFLKKDTITFHVGGGIVADSNPDQEWQETWDKARPLIESLEEVLA